MDIERISFQKFLINHGWHCMRQVGSHIQYKKSGEKKVITLVAEKTLSPGLVNSALRIMNISKEQFLTEFNSSKKKKRKSKK